MKECTFCGSTSGPMLRVDEDKFVCTKCLSEINRAVEANSSSSSQIRLSWPWIGLEEQKPLLPQRTREVV